MASFCKECSDKLFGEDFGDFANITTPYQAAEGFYCWVLCEGCGLIQVDPDGARVGAASVPHE